MLIFVTRCHVTRCPACRRTILAAQVLSFMLYAAHAADGTRYACYLLPLLYANCVPLCPCYAPPRLAAHTACFSSHIAMILAAQAYRPHDTPCPQYSLTTILTATILAAQDTCYPRYSLHTILTAHSTRCPRYLLATILAAHDTRCPRYLLLCYYALLCYTYANATCYA